MGGGLESGFDPETRKLIRSDFSIKVKEAPLQTSYYSSKLASQNCVWTVKQQVRELVIVGKEMFGPWPTPDPLLSSRTKNSRIYASRYRVTQHLQRHTNLFQSSQRSPQWCLVLTLILIWDEIRLPQIKYKQAIYFVLEHNIQHLCSMV